MRVLVAAIKSQLRDTDENYEESTTWLWTGLKAIVIQTGGSAAFDDAAGVDWATSLIAHKANPVKVFPPHHLPFSPSLPSLTL
jgi:hypothetical protein